MCTQFLRSSLPALLVLTGSTAWSATYYVSPAGNNNQSGTSPAQAWRTIDRVQQIAGSLQPGDQVLFERGGVFPGQLTLNASGTANSPIVIGAYGSGDAPVINGAIAATGWTNYEGNIWRASVAQAVKYVHINGTPMTLARYPNTGWLRNASGSTTSLNSADLTQPNGHWNGARLVVRSTNWCYETPTVSGFTNGTLTFPAITFNLGSYEWGFYLCNKLSELDAPGEWYHDASTGQLYLWAPGGADPNTLPIEASVHDHGIVAGWQRQHIRIQDLSFRGQKTAGVRNDGASRVTVTNCRFDRLYVAISSYGSYGQYTNNIITNTYASGIVVLDNNSTISGNQLTDVGLVPGWGETMWGYFGIHAMGNANQVRENRLQNIGYSGIFLKGNDVLVERNVIDHSMATLNDGGGIHYDEVNGLQVRDNIVLGLTGNLESSAPDHNAYYKICHGIYFGYRAIINTTVERNTVAHCKGSGIHVDHSMVTSGVQVKDNVLYGNEVQLSISDYSNNVGTGATPPYHVPNYNDVYSGNILYSLDRNQLCMKQFHVYSADPVDFGTYTNNRYFNPFNELSIFVQNIVSGSQRFYTLERWQVEESEDAGSTRSPLALNAHEVTQVVGGNLLANGNFDSNTSGWSGWPTQGQITRDMSLLDNGALKLTFANPSTYQDHFLRHDALATLQNGAWYELRFSLQSNLHGILRTEFKTQSQLTGPHAVFTRALPFDGQRREISIIFQSNVSEPGQCRFINNYTESNYWMDNVTLRQVEVIPVDPMERHVLFINDSGSSLDLQLDGCWRDVGGALHSGSITLSPFSSIVLVREEDELCGLTTGGPEEQASASPLLIHPNPVQAGGLVQMTGHGSLEATAQVYDAGGRLVLSARIAKGQNSLQLPAALGPGIYNLLVRTQEDHWVHRLAVER